MAQKTISELKSDVNSRFPNNTSRLINPTVTRSELNDIIDSHLNCVDLNPISVLAVTDFENGVTQGGLQLKPLYEIIVNSLGDLPADVGGVITLAANTTYRISGTLALGSLRLVLSQNTQIIGTNRRTDIITYTGTGALITSTTSHQLREIGLQAVNGKVFDLDGASTVLYSNIYVIDCNEVGTLNNVGRFIARSFSVVDYTTDGLSISGTGSEFFLDNSTWTVPIGTGIDFTTATFDFISITTGVRFNVASGATGINIAASSANINSGGAGIISHVLFKGIGTYISGYQPYDLRWDASGNNGITNSRSLAQGHITSSALTTTFGATNTPTLVNFGTAYLSDIAERFTISTAGRYTYNGLEQKSFMIDCTIFASISGGAARKYNWYIAKGGSIMASSVSKAQYDGSTPASCSVSTIVTLTTGEYLELYVTALDATTAITVDTVSLKVFGV